MRLLSKSRCTALMCHGGVLAFDSMIIAIFRLRQKSLESGIKEPHPNLLISQPEQWLHEKFSVVLFSIEP